MSRPMRDLQNSILLCAIFIAPIFVHHGFGRLPLVDYGWVANHFPKMQADFINMRTRYGEASAIDFGIFFITGFVLANISLLILFLYYLRMLKLGLFFQTLSTGLDGTNPEFRESARDKIIMLGMFCAVLTSILWYFPFWLFESGPYTIKPGLRGEFTLALMFSSYALFTALFAVAAINYWKTNDPNHPV